jgi:hypothetical protein
MEKNNSLKIAKSLTYLNIGGIIILMFYSVALRYQLMSMIKNVTASDFTVHVKNIPPTTTKEQLTQIIEKKYASQKIKVSNVNYCYNVDEMMAF